MKKYRYHNVYSRCRFIGLSSCSPSYKMSTECLVFFLDWLPPFTRLHLVTSTALCCVLRHYHQLENRSVGFFGSWEEKIGQSFFGRSFFPHCDRLGSRSKVWHVVGSRDTTGILLERHVTWALSGSASPSRLDLTWPYPAKAEHGLSTDSTDICYIVLSHSDVRVCSDRSIWSIWSIYMRELIFNSPLSHSKIDSDFPGSLRRTARTCMLQRLLLFGCRTYIILPVVFFRYLFWPFQRWQFCLCPARMIVLHVLDYLNPTL